MKSNARISNPISAITWLVSFQIFFLNPNSKLGLILTCSPDPDYVKRKIKIAKIANPATTERISQYLAENMGGKILHPSRPSEKVKMEPPGEKGWPLGIQRAAGLRLACTPGLRYSLSLIYLYLNKKNSKNKNSMTISKNNFARNGR